MPRYNTPFLRGDVLNKTYCLRRPLGVGGLGDVWEAEHCQTGDRFALKLLQPKHIETEEYRARLNREFAVLEKARHRSVVVCHGRGELWEWFRQGGPLEDNNCIGLPFLILEMVEGENLQKQLYRRRKEGGTRTERAYTLEEARNVFDPILEVLEELHAENILHRDLKPGNIVLDAVTREAKLLDWNLGKVPGDQIALTTVGHKDCGSPPYCSPEQLKSLLLAGTRSDIFSMAAVMVEALTGIYFRFFLNEKGILDLDLVRQILAGTPWPQSHGAAAKVPQGSGPHIASPLARKLVAALSPKPSERPESARILREALAEVSSDSAHTLVALPRKDVAPISEDAATRVAHPCFSAPAFNAPATRSDCQAVAPTAANSIAPDPAAVAGDSPDETIDTQGATAFLAGPSKPAPETSQPPPTSQLQQQNDRLRLALAIIIGAVLTFLLAKLF